MSRRRAVVLFVLSAAVVIGVGTTAGRSERFDACLVCGVVRGEVRAWSIPLHRKIGETPGFTEWVRARKPEHDEHYWVFSHTLEGDAIDCSKSPLPYVVSGLYANVGATPEVEAFLDTVDAEVRAGVVEEAALIARSDAIRLEHERRSAAEAR